MSTRPSLSARSITCSPDTPLEVSAIVLFLSVVGAGLLVVGLIRWESSKETEFVSPDCLEADFWKVSEFIIVRYAFIPALAAGGRGCNHSLFSAIWVGSGYGLR